MSITAQLATIESQVRSWNELLRIGILSFDDYSVKIAEATDQQQALTQATESTVSTAQAAAQAMTEVADAVAQATAQMTQSAKAVESWKQLAAEGKSSGISSGKTSQQLKDEYFNSVTFDPQSNQRILEEQARQVVSTYLAALDRADTDMAREQQRRIQNEKVNDDALRAKLAAELRSVQAQYNAEKAKQDAALAEISRISTQIKGQEGTQAYKDGIEKNKTLQELAAYSKQTMDKQFSPVIKQLEATLKGFDAKDEAAKTVQAIQQGTLSPDQMAALRESTEYQRQIEARDAQQQKAIDEQTAKLESLYASATADQKLTAPEVQAIEKLATQLEALQKVAEDRVAKVYEIRIGNQSIKATSDPAEFLKALESSRRSAT